jgi:hypothetical protein
MMTAAQAKVKTQERIKVLATEFIINNVGVPLQDAIDAGEFHCSVHFEGNKRLGAEVVNQLQDQGYTAEHVYYDGPNGYNNYILIKWEDD